jgi:type IV pilus assembly protein PilA
MLWMSKSLNNRVHHQKGFTLLELLMVIAVIGVLASIAVPRFLNASSKAKFTEVINAAGPYKTAVELCVINTGSATACNAGDQGIPAGYTGGTGKAASVGVVAGVVTVTGNTADFGNVASTYTLTPVVVNGVSGVSWTVGGTCKAQELCNY